MSKQEEILRECMISGIMESNKKNTNRRNRSTEELYEETKKEFEEFITDKQMVPIVRAIYSAMDKYHNSFIKK